MPKSTIHSEKPKITREFTVKLSPFPPMNRNLSNQNLSDKKIISPENVLLKPLPSNDNLNISNITPTQSATFNRSVKRPIVLNEEVTMKRVRNCSGDTDDFDDQDILEQTSTIKSNKRSTQILEHSCKRIKNNEILSSYSSNSSYHNRNFKRKFSPDSSAPNEFIKNKKRTFIEELELLTSDNSPYYKDIYSSNFPDKTKVSSKLSADHEPDDIEITHDVIEIPEDKAIFEQQEDMISENPIDDKFDEERSNVPNEEIELYPLPMHVYSIKDHEFDKKKVKNRLDRFRAAVQQANEENSGKQTEDQTDSKETSNVEPSSTFSKVDFKPSLPTNSAISFGENEILKTSAQASMASTVLVESKPCGITLNSNIPISSFSVSTTTAPAVSTVFTTTQSNPTTFEMKLASTTANPPSTSYQSSNSSLQMSTASSFTVPSFSSPSNLQLKPAISTSFPNSTKPFSFGSLAVTTNSINPSNQAITFNTSSSSLLPTVSSTGFSLPSSTTTSTFSLPSLSSQSTTLPISTTVKTQASATFNFSSSTSSQAPSTFTLPTTASGQASSIFNIPTTTPSQTSFGLTSSVSPQTTSMFNISSSLPQQSSANPSQISNTSFMIPTTQSTNSSGNVFSFGQSQQPSVSANEPKPSFNFSHVKPISMNMGNTNSPQANMFAFNSSNPEKQNSITTSVPTNSNPAFSFNTANNTPTNMFAFNSNTPVESKPANKGFNFQPGPITFDFKANSTPTNNLMANKPSTTGFNFSAASKPSVGFNFSQSASSISNPNPFQ